MGVFYRRVIPRDLFNEASLLKCLGHLYIATEGCGVLLLHTGPDWSIHQNEDDGSIYASAVSIIIGGVTYDHYRPLNSRDPWPLWLRRRNDPEAEEFEAFDEDGGLSPEILALMKGQA